MPETPKARPEPKITLELTYKEAEKVRERLAGSRSNVSQEVKRRLDGLIGAVEMGECTPPKGAQ